MSQAGTFETSVTMPVDTLTGNVGGAVSADGASNINIVGGGIVTVTGNPGTNTLTITSTGGVDQVDIFYVGKHGNDANDGLAIEKAFLTFGFAITAASSGDVISCADDGTYTEDLTGAAGISIFAPNATLAGAHTIEADNHWTFKELTVATGVVGVTLNSAGNSAFLKADKMTMVGTGIGVLNLAGVLYTTICDASLVNGFFLGSTTADETYIQFHEIAITGTGIAFAALAGGEVQVSGQCVENSGAGNCTVFFTGGGGAPEINATITHIHSDILSNITAGSEVYLNSSAMHGALVESGAGTVIVGGATRIDEVPIGAVTPSSGAFTTLSCTTPLPVTSGGIGVATLTDHGILLGSGATAITPTAAMTDGQVLIGSTGVDPVPATLTAGANVTIVEAAGSITISSLGGVPYVEATGATQAMAVNTGYTTNNGAQLDYTLPATIAVGEVVAVVGNSANGFTISQNAGQTVHFLDSDTTPGVGGSLTSTTRYDCVTLRCVTADTAFVVETAVGNLTVV